MHPTIAKLPWLPPPPDDFLQRCRGLAEGDGRAGTAVHLLSGFRLNAFQSGSLARALGRLRAADRDLSPLSGFRLGILANATIDLLIDCLPAAGARHGVVLGVQSAPYDQVAQQALDPTSKVNTARLDAVLIAVDHRWLDLNRASLSESPKGRVDAAVQRLRVIVESLRLHGRAAAILQTVPVPPHALFGSYDRRFAGSIRAMLDEANRRIAALAEETGSYILDVAGLAERVGTDLWFDPVQWVTHKLPCSPECLPIYAEMLGRLLGAIRGKARKCLVLDLDNTIWGGVIGDDGMEGIVIGQGTPLGEAFLSVQRAAADLRERGIVLAVCSKNTDAVARRPFREHPEMLLREAHVAVFQANWLDKPSNLEAIARALNIGLDALVLIDDNPAERAEVREALPMVAVPELPDDPSWFAWYLNAAGYFEAVTYSRDDKLRAESYASDSQRAEVMAKARDLGDYLSSLAMVITFSQFDRTGLQRVAQLINKTNQFNLTTRRYTEAQVEAMAADSSWFTLQVRLEDKFGDLGMIEVVICHPAEHDKTTWEIDTWLMSCRVLGRKVEEATLRRIVAEARQRGIRQVVGTYIPTAKNEMVSEHYSKLGFALTEDSAKRRRFVLTVEDHVSPGLPFKVVENARPNPSYTGDQRAGQDAVSG